MGPATIITADTAKAVPVVDAAGTPVVAGAAAGN
jgi:hypothetical protein